MQRIKRAKTLTRIVFGMSCFLLCSTIGGMEYGSLSLTAGGIICIVCLLGMWASVKFNDWLDAIVAQQRGKCSEKLKKNTRDNIVGFQNGKSA